MRFHSSLLVLALVTASCGISQAAPVRKIVPKGAVSFTSKAQGFAVWFPDQPRQGKDARKPFQGKARTIYWFTVDSKPGRPLTYAVLVEATRPNLGVSGRAEAAANWQKSVLQDGKFKLQSQEEIQLGDSNGREIQMQLVKKGSIWRSRYYSTAKRFYRLVAVGSEAEMQKQAAQINRVFDSFRILPQ